MRFKRLRRKVQKRFRRSQQQFETLSVKTEKSFERNVFKRFSRLLPVRRFVFGWVGLMLLLIGCLLAQLQHLSGYYQRVEPVPGGIYSEGIVGSISNVSPLYATSDVDRSLSRLVFGGLLALDANNQIVGNLAESYDIGNDGRVYTLKLKQGLTWHDGQPLTSADVLFTFNTIKDPDARSPFITSWQNISITAADTYTVTFTLPSPLASFTQNLTTGIVPRHILGSVSAANMRSADFNTLSPIGAGPFKWRGLEVSGNDPAEIEERVALVPFDAYAGGQPKLNEFIVRVFASEDRLREAFQSGQLSAAAGLRDVPEQLSDNAKTNNMVMAAGTYVFFKTSNELLKSAKIRQALVAASAPNEIIDSLGYLTRPVTAPILLGQLGYNKDYAQKTGDPATAGRLLAEEGWVRQANGMLTKDGKPLQFNLVATDTKEYRSVAEQLRKQWQAIGVTLNVQVMPAADFTTTLGNHDYDAALYGISIGNDPDVYAYWHSSQADVRANNRLNLSEWNNPVASAALEAGRTRLDPALRTIKYAPLLQEWQKDSPALGLYQPRFLYVTRGQVYGLTERPIASSIDRFNGVEHWQVRTARVTRGQ